MELLDIKMLSEVQIVYPSPSNPRLKGLTVEEASIQSLAESIRLNGQLQPILVRQLADGRVETVDGDRRCVAVFKVLKYKTIKASVYRMNDREAVRLRLIANIQKEDLTPTEKGRYCVQLFNAIVKEDNLDAGEAWGNRHARSKYLATVSAEIGVSPSTVINWIRLWESFPREAQKLIAGNKEELRKGLIPPSTALAAAQLARHLKTKAEHVLWLTMKNKWTPEDLAKVSSRVRRGEKISFSNLEETIILDKRRTIRRIMNFELKPYRELLRQSKEHKMRFDEYMNIVIKFAVGNTELFRNYVLALVTKMNPAKSEEEK